MVQGVSSQMPWRRRLPPDLLVMVGVRRPNAAFLVVFTIESRDTKM